ncbi:MAG: DUF3990 domain-containing protein [Treponema sp.]|jgi:hypothetical protein|nr:DUF3990 domain-containing protein [Treponema sp.]
MELYHGSNVAVEKPNLALSRKNLDFGIGFYTTVNKNQAEDFARKVMIRNRQEKPLVSVYEFDINAAEPALDILRFTAPDRLWLDFVHQNRRGLYTGKMYDCMRRVHTQKGMYPETNTLPKQQLALQGEVVDLVIGPVANDDVFATLLIYEQGILNVEQTLEALKVKELYSQFVFKTERALSLLRYANSFTPEAAK